MFGIFGKNESGQRPETAERSDTGIQTERQKETGEATQTAQETQRTTPEIPKLDRSLDQSIRLGSLAHDSGLFSADAYTNLNGQPLVDQLSSDYMQLSVKKRTAIQIPTDQSSDEELNAFFKQVEGVDGIAIIGKTEESHQRFLRQLGVPEKESDYTVPLELKLDAEQQQEIISLSHKLSLTQEQTDALSETVHGELSAMDDQSTATHADRQKQRDDALHSEWGDGITSRLKGAQLAAEQVSSRLGGDWMEHLKTSGALDNPVVVMALSKLGEGLVEKGLLVDTQVKFPDNVEAINVKIAGIRNNPNYFGTSEQSRVLRKQLVALSKQLHTNKEC